MTLGALRATAAIPALAKIVQYEDTDGDTRFTAAQALGNIARRRFDRQPDPIAAALAWLDRRHGN